MLLVMTAKIVDQGAQRHRPVAFELGAPLPLRLLDASQQLQGLRPRGAELRQYLLRVAARVTALLREGLAVDRWKPWSVFREGAAEARLVTLDLDVTHVADLLDGREWLARHAIPGWRLPVHEWRRKQRVMCLERRGKRGQRFAGGVHGRHCASHRCGQAIHLQPNLPSNAASEWPIGSGAWSRRHRATPADSAFSK